MHTILVVDDDKKIVRLVKSYLEQSGFRVLTAYNGEVALHTIRREKPDLVILDLMLPDRDGWDIIRVVRSDPALGSLPVIMLTARVEDTDKIIGLELGADDYITKPFNPREVVARVKSVLRRSSSAVAPLNQTIKFGNLTVEIERRQTKIDEKSVALTPTEFDILQIMLQNRGRVFSRADLIEQVLGYSYSGPDRTIDTHIKNLRKKIEPDPAHPVIIKTVYGVGYALGDESDML